MISKVSIKGANCVYSMYVHVVESVWQLILSDMQLQDPNDNAGINHGGLIR